MNYIKTYNSEDFTDCGNKFSNLAKISTSVKIPQGVCLTSNALRDSLPSNSYKKIDELLNLLKSNGGYQLNRIHKQINGELANLKFNDILIKELQDVYNNLSIKKSTPLIVRSSSIYEDSNDVSGAGIYESKGNVLKVEELFDAISYCWREFFSLSALAHRLRIKEYTLTNLPALIIQEHLQGTYSGVTFSQDPISTMKGILTEYTSNNTDGIESGKDIGHSFKAFENETGYIISANELPSNIVSELLKCQKKIEKLYTKPMEFEWLVADGNFYVVQTRPITGISDTAKEYQNNKPYIKTYEAYTEYDVLSKMDLGDVTEVYLKSINKRKPVRDLAVKSGMNVHGVSVIQANQLGIDLFDISKFKELNRINTPLLTIDLGPHIRSFYTKRINVNNTLKTLLKYAAGNTSFIVREFASGKYAAISSLVDNQTCIVEICRGSLIGINRGFVETNTYSINLNTHKVDIINPRNYPKRYYDFDSVNQCFAFIESDTEEKPDIIKKSILLEIAGFTKTVNDAIGHISLEWTIVDDKPVFIDHTNLADIGSLNNLNEDKKNYYFLSKGKIDGKAVIVRDIDRFEYISSGPTLNVSGHAPAMNDNPEIINLLNMAAVNKDMVIVSKYPYTAFSVLVDKVKGFVFESGPLLCHLSIVCREQKTPIAIVSRALDKFKDGDNIYL